MFDQLFVSFFCFHFLILLFSLVFTLNFSKHGCSEGKDKKIGLVLRIIHVFVYVCEACCDIQALILQAKLEKFVILSLIYENMKH